MRTALITSIVLGLAASPARADIEPRAKWARWENAKLGLVVMHPAATKVEVTAFGVRVTGAEIATVEVVVTETKERNSSKSGGQAENSIDWVIAVPKRTAKCHAQTDDNDKAVVASAICDALEVKPGPRDPHVEMALTSEGLADGAAYEHAVRGKQKAVDACWKAALAKDAGLTEGSLTVRRTFVDGAPAETNERAENFFDHNTKALAACVFGLVEAVPAKATGKDASIKVDLVCRLY